MTKAEQMGIKVKKKRIKSQLTKLKAKLEPLVKEYVKRRDNYTCLKCGRVVSGSNCHASHIFSVGAYPNLKFDPDNMKVLCYHCHLNWWHKNPLESGEWFRHNYADWFQRLELKKMIPVKLKEQDYVDLIQKYKV